MRFTRVVPPPPKKNVNILYQARQSCENTTFERQAESGLWSCIISARETSVIYRCSWLDPRKLYKFQIIFSFNNQKQVPASSLQSKKQYFAPVRCDMRNICSSKNSLRFQQKLLRNWLQYISKTSMLLSIAKFTTCLDVKVHVQIK